MLLLRQVHRADQGELVPDHLWFTCAKTWCDPLLRPGERIAFDARVSRYEKGYTGGREEAMRDAPAGTDYRLERPTRVEPARSRE